MNARIRELEEKLASFSGNEKDSEESVDTLSELAWEIALGDTKRALELTREAEAISRKLGYERGLAFVLRNLGYCAVARSNLEEALSHSQEAAKRFEKLGDVLGQATAEDTIALTFWRLGNFDKAMQHSLTALELNRKVNNKRGEAWALRNLAAISHDVGDQERAIANYQKAYELFQQIDYKLGLSGILKGLGDVFVKTGDFNKALDYFFEAREMGEQLGIQLVLATTLTDIGAVYEKMGEWDKAFEYHEKSLALFDHFESKEAKAHTLLNLARLYGQRNEHEKALELLNQSLALVDQTKAKPTAFKVRQALFETYQSLGDYEEALQHHIAFHRLKEEVYNEESTTKVRNLQIRTELERAEKEAEIRRLQVVNREKMALLENLVAGLAHEVNSPLGVIRSHAQISERITEKLVKEFADLKAQEQLPAVETVNRLTGILSASSTSALNAAERISNLISGLQRFASLDRAEVQMVDVRQNIENTLDLLRSKISEKIDLVTEFAETPQIKAYPQGLNQVFMTLLINAFDALGEEGQIRIQTSANNEHVHVKISDTGKGIAQDHLDRIFDIGFSAKDAKIQMNLGLANAYHIIQRHKGEIAVSSEVGRGTEFLIKLPVKH